MMVACADLLEAEGRALRRGAVRAGSALALVCVAALTVLGGLAALSWSLYRALSAPLGEAGAAAMLGGALLVIGGVLAWIVKRLSS